MLAKESKRSWLLIGLMTTYVSSLRVFYSCMSFSWVCVIFNDIWDIDWSFSNQDNNRGTLVNIIRLRAKKGPAPPHLGNFANISYLIENFKPHLLRDVCTLCSGALVSDRLLHMLL